MDRKNNIDLKINIVGWGTIILALCFIFFGFLFFGNVLGLLFFIAPLLVILGSGVILRKDSSRIWLRGTYLFILIPCILYTLFLLYFLISAPWFLFFEGRTGIKMLITLLLVTPFMLWSEKLLDRKDIKEKFNKKNFS